MNRSSGVLMHVSSLPSDCGIGTFGQEAFNFVDFLSKAGLKWWQMLPVCPIDDAGSPYQSFSTFAGNVLFINFNLLQKEGLIDSCNLHWGDNDTAVDFKLVKENVDRLLCEACHNWLNRFGDKALLDFMEKNDWVLNYAMFMVLLKKFNGNVWWNWPDEFKIRNEKAINDLKSSARNEILQIVFNQFMFFKQWHELRTYAKNKGVGLIGDVPIYVAGNSADVWANPENFCLNDRLEPKKIAGCPPDAFSAEGQLWGNPVYNWKRLKETNFDWWIKRFKSVCSMFDIVRIDHFRGFESFYSVDSKEKNAVNGEWVKGPGIEFFKQVEARLGKLNLIAEDLGFLTEETRELLRQTGFPGIKILQFAFDPREKSVYLPYTYVQNSVCYTGTHDNNTAVGWFDEIDEDSKAYCKAYLNFETEPVHWALIREVMASVCNLAIIPVQDFLGLDETCRMNTPGTTVGNWQWRLTLEQFDELNKLSEKIKNMVQLYGR